MELFFLSVRLEHVNKYNSQFSCILQFLTRLERNQIGRTTLRLVTPEGMKVHSSIFLLLHCQKLSTVYFLESSYLSVAVFCLTLHFNTQNFPRRFFFATGRVWLHWTARNPESC